MSNGSVIGYKYGDITNTTGLIQSNHAKMADTVTRAMTNAKTSFDSMDASAKPEMQGSFNRVMTTGQNTLAAIHSVNTATNNANDAMQSTDSLQVGRFV